MKTLVEGIILFTFTFLLSNICLGQGVPKLNDSKDIILKNIIWDFQNTPNYFPLINSKDSVSQII